jgi:hypothetical protein
LIQMAIDVVSMLVGIVVGVVITAPILWVAGRLLVGAAKARFIDAVIIVVLGTIAGQVIGQILSGTIGALVQLVVILLLIKKYYECDWLRALAVAVITVVLLIFVSAALAMIGLAIFAPVN